MISLWPIQQAIYTALTANPQTYPVFDATPQDQAPPYIVIGESFNESDLDIDVESSSATINIHGWSRTKGKEQSYAIMSFIRARLHHQSIGGAWACYSEQEDVFEDRDSTPAKRLYHAVCRYRIRLN